LTKAVVRFCRKSGGADGAPAAPAHETKLFGENFISVYIDALSEIVKRRKGAPAKSARPVE
jgi:hypothetical protein